MVQDSYHVGEWAINQTRLLVSGVLRKLWIFLRRKIIRGRCLLRVLDRKEKQDS